MFITSFPKDIVSDLAERILYIMVAHPTVNNIILHKWTKDVVKQQSEVLKLEFIDLLNTVSSLNAEVFLTGRLPSAITAVERFSRLLALNT